MKKNLWFWLTLFASLLSFVLSVTRVILLTPDGLSQLSSLTFILLATLTPWLVRVVYITETLRVRSQDQMVNEVFSVTPKGPRQYCQIAKELLTVMRDQYQALCEDGRASIKGHLESINLYTSFFRTSRARNNIILATSMIRTSSWNCDLYELNKRFLEHGGKIRRIFIYESEEQRCESNVEAMRQYAFCKNSPSLELFLYDLKKAQDAILMNTIVDFIIDCNHNIAVQFAVSSGQIAGGTLLANTMEVKALIKLHAVLQADSIAVSLDQSKKASN